jgi:hypothetical protein
LVNSENEVGHHDGVPEYSLLSVKAFTTSSHEGISQISDVTVRTTASTRREVLVIEGS